MGNYFELTFLLTVHFHPLVAPVKYKAYEEGSCPQFTPQQDCDQNWLSTGPLNYVAAGDKYHLYRMISSFPPLEDITMDDFIHNACIKRFQNISSGDGGLSAFGKDAVTMYHITLTDQKGVIDFQPLGTTETVIARHTVTLTDNATFAFFATCWQDSHQKGFDVVSITPSLDASAQKWVTDHAISLGFDPANFIFFPEDVCDGK